MIYLDHNATSPLLPSAREAMDPWLGVPCNPSSAHQLGQRAAAAVERARAEVAALVGKEPREVVFTSGATEANHMWFEGRRGDVVAMGATEHPSVHAAAVRAGRALLISVDSQGQLGEIPTADAYSVMAANHETGVVHDLGRLPGPLHVDASAAAGRMSLDLPTATVTVSAHKIGGPLGVGALIGTGIEALFAGSQQRGKRGGTVNTPAVVGFGAAAALALRELGTRRAKWEELQGTLVAALVRRGARIMGPPGLPTVVNAVFAGLPAEMVVAALDLRGVCVSAGAACASGSVDRSPVLEAMGEPEADGGVRFSMGWSTTAGEIDGALVALDAVLEGLAPLRT